MPKGYPTTSCRSCHRPMSECGRLSATYQCRDCGNYRALRNHHDLKAHAGPFFDHWRRRSLAALGVFVHDEARQ